MPKFSIITISKNPGKTIIKTIESVSMQTFSDFEYILIDGKSDNETAELIDAFSEFVDKIIIEEDNGIYDAMNKGIKQAKGDFIIFLNAGDHFTTNYSLAAINTKIKQTKAEIYFGKILWVDTHNNNVITSKHEHIKYKSQLFYENFPHPATIYSKQVFEKYGLFNLNFPVYADYEWNLRALIKFNASFSYINTVITTFYTGGISTNNERQEQKRDEKKTVKYIYFQKQPKKINPENISILKRIKIRLIKDKLNKVY